MANRNNALAKRERRIQYQIRRETERLETLYAKRGITEPIDLVAIEARVRREFADYSEAARSTTCTAAPLNPINRQVALELPANEWREPIEVGHEKHFDRPARFVLKTGHPAKIKGPTSRWHPQELARYQAEQERLATVRESGVFTLRLIDPVYRFVKAA